MALVLTVEDGTGLANSNGYISLADAVLFFEGYTFKADWTGTDAQKTAALVQASRTIDTQFVFAGKRTKADTQAMQWPRAEVREPDRLVPSDEIPRAVKEATCLLAMAILANEAFMTRDPGAGGADQIQSVNLGSGALQVEFQPQSTEGSISNRYKTIVGPEVLALLEAYGTFRQGSGMTRVRRA